MSFLATKSVSEFTSTTAPLLPVNGNRNQTFGRNAAAFLAAEAQTFFAQPVNGGFHVAVGFGQGFFAVQHAGAGAFS